MHYVKDILPIIFQCEYFMKTSRVLLAIYGQVEFQKFRSKLKCTKN